MLTGELKGNLTNNVELKGKLAVSGMAPNLIEGNFTENGEYVPVNADGYSKAIVNVQPDLIEGNFTENGEYVPVNADGYSKAIVNVQPDLIEGNFTENGEYVPVNADGYSKVNVNVPGGIPANNNGQIEYIRPSNNQQLGVIYGNFSFRGRQWSFNNNFTTPVFTTPRPNTAAKDNAACFLEGYVSDFGFWNLPNKDKHVGITTNSITISDLSFNGDVRAFTQYMNNKSIYLVLNEPVFLDS